MVRMLVLRPDPDGMQSAEHLRALDIDATLLPLFRRTLLETSLPEPNGFAALALTSANALRALAERGVIERFCNIKTFTVGDKTAAEARALGFSDVSSAGGTLANLVEHMAHHKLEGPVFYPAGKHLSGDLARSLAPYGVMVVTARLYDMVAIEALPDAVIAALEAGEIAAALFYSRRAAETFASLTRDRLSRATRTQLGMLCLSEGVAGPLVKARFVQVNLADYPSEDTMMALALSFARDQNAP